MYYHTEITSAGFQASNIIKSADVTPKIRSTFSEYDIFVNSDSNDQWPAYYNENNNGNETRDFLHFLVRTNYDHRKEPENDNGVVTISVSIVVSNIRAVSEVTMDYALELFYRESWLDQRLHQRDGYGKRKITLHESYINFLWHPDTFMPNAIASKNPQKHSISHRSLLRLNEDGTILYSRRISILAECPMDLTLFPFDSQLCKLGIENGYTADRVRYSWSKDVKAPLLLQKIRLPDFQIKEAYVTSVTENYATGNYSRLYVCFLFIRSSGFCLMQLVVPSTAVVITSWVSLWMESDTEFQDMISIILAITFLIFSYNEMMPRVSYIKAMDIYLGVCFMFVFLSLIKLAFVKFMMQKLNRSRFLRRRPSLLLTSVPPNVNLSANGVFTESAIIGLQRTSSFNFEVSPWQEGSNRISNSYTSIPINDPSEVDNYLQKQQYSRWSNFKNFLNKCRFSKRSVYKFHWISQLLFLITFVSFCLFYFLLYPNMHVEVDDAACDRTKSEWFAEIA
ncbi:unnamed protein product [Thelazia callipaeda]|uniref:Neurotransmitter-gated ion-channel ligand-binding domain-containing protein n=1 Tax=Thelazia callipaeda TaxID=103827 RepID=A0A0N5CS25_THECL|nr:unnamed protein product [Thelazia callipaeda]